MNKEKLLIIIILIASFFIGTRLFFQKVVLVSSKKDFVPSSVVNTHQNFNSQKGFASSSNIRPQFKNTQNINMSRKITVKQPKAQVKVQTSVSYGNSDLKYADRNKDAKKQEISNYASEVRHRLEKQDEFLKLKVGLNNEQITMVHTKNLMFQKQIEFASLLALKKSPSANRIKMMILDEHSNWMTYVLGAENFAEYIQLAPTSSSPGTKEI